MSEKISAMTDAGPLLGNELVPIVQGGNNVKSTLGEILVELGGQILADMTIFASPTGDNSNDGFTSATPKKIDGAFAWITDKTIADDVVVTLQLLDGTYKLLDPIECAYYFGAKGSVTVQGNITDQTKVVIDCDSAFSGDTMFLVEAPITQYKFAWMTLQNTNGSPIFADFRFANLATVIIGEKLVLGNSPGLFAHFYGSNGAKFTIDLLATKLYMTGAPIIHVRADTHSFVDYIVGSGFSIDTLGNTIALSSFINITGLSYAGLYAPSGVIPVVGTITGVKGDFSTNSVSFAFINTADILLPGSSPVTYASGAQHN